MRLQTIPWDFISERKYSKKSSALNAFVVCKKNEKKKHPNFQFLSMQIIDIIMMIIVTITLTNDNNNDNIDNNIDNNNDNGNDSYKKRSD